MTQHAPSVERTLAREFLRERATRVSDDPQVNSVFALARKYFANLEAGSTSLAHLSELVDDIYLSLAEARAQTFRNQHFPTGEDFETSVRRRLIDIAAQGWETFRDSLESPSGGLVFTAHPTFAVPRVTREAMATHAAKWDDSSFVALKNSLDRDPASWSGSISLAGEHEEAQLAIANAQSAMEVFASLIFEIAKNQFPQKWRSLRPALPSLASWVGYDLDGRTDINWWQSFRFRLLEKSSQLSRYAKKLEALQALPELASRLRGAAQLSLRHAVLFENDLSEPENLVAAVEEFTKEDADQIVSASEIINEIDQEVRRADDEMAGALCVLRSEVDVCQLGTARIHLRVNAAQVRAVLSRDLDLETEHRELGRVALQELSKMAAGPELREVGFADLFLEQSTARRQMMMCALWLKHIDAGSPIRFLIAEAENPATVMGALYLARQYSIESQVDISPLFETPEALETGGRFIARLLEEPAFMEYLRTRGQLSIQLGFSDAGRFIGQVAADMAIERIHNLIRAALAKVDPAIALLIFNTHGESMGRGAWPGSFENRFDHLLSCWTRSQSAKNGVALRHEVSFQGGDGYLHFGNDALARATYFAWCQHVLSEPADCLQDPFYTDRDFSWDTYRSLRTWHERLFNDADYGHLLSDFATNFLVRAGSRQRRRKGGPTGPRALRAISHNATLQQLGVPVNTAAGIGSSIRRETARLIELINASPRMRSLIELGVSARLVTSVPALRAYAQVYDPGYWVAISRHADPQKATAYRRVYYSLNDSTTYASVHRIANRFSVDLGKFDRLLAALDDAPSIEERHEGRLDLHILHAIRQSMMMHALSLAAQLPSLSDRHDTSMEDLMQLVQEMRISDAAELLEQAFPQSATTKDGLRRLLDDRINPLHKGYDEMHTSLIGPLKTISALMHKTSLAISQAYHAYG